MADDRLIIRCSFCGEEYDWAKFAGGFSVYDEYRCEDETTITPWLNEHLECRRKAIGLDLNGLDGIPGFDLVTESRPKESGGITS